MTLPQIPDDVTAVLIVVQDAKNLRIPAILNAVQNTTQTITVVMPEIKQQMVVVCPPVYCPPVYCPPVYYQCSAPACGCRLFGFWHR